MVITVASGKGGTGKTTFAVNLACALSRQGENVRLLDCDVEAPNDHLFMNPEFEKDRAVTVLKPVLDETQCTGCGQCAEACRYNAIAVVKGKVMLFNELCHSCGVCSFVCPENAFQEKAKAIGTVSETGPAARPWFSHGRLNVGETLAPTVVEAVKEGIDPDAVNIIDASPGTACPVVKALEDADAAVLVTEPTPFGLNDLKLAVSMTLKMRIPTGIVVNRSDGRDDIIAQYAESIGVPVVGRIPFKRAYAETYSSGAILVDRHPELADTLVDIYNAVHTLQRSIIAPVPETEPFELSIASDAALQKGDAVDRREITIISGKGGTGKTTLTACFAQLTQQQVLADNDVDAADLHLLLQPAVREAHPFAGGLKAVIDFAKCTGCGKCVQACHFNAIRFDGPPNANVAKTCRIESFACEGCGLCPRVCPAGAVESEEAVTGQWYVASTPFGPMAHARLGIAEENSGRLVSQVRRCADRLAQEQRFGRILADGPPGTGCPVIASVTGADLVVIVTEPTVSGVHDMERVLDLAAHFGIKTAIVVNKADINETQASRITGIAEKRGSPVVGCVPFDRNVHDSLMAGKTLLDYDRSSTAAQAVVQAWEKVIQMIGKP